MTPELINVVFTLKESHGRVSDIRTKEGEYINFYGFVASEVKVLIFGSVAIGTPALRNLATRVLIFPEVNFGSVTPSLGVIQEPLQRFLRVQTQDLEVPGSPPDIPRNVITFDRPTLNALYYTRTLHDRREPKTWIRRTGERVFEIV